MQFIARGVGIQRAKLRHARAIEESLTGLPARDCRCSVANSQNRFHFISPTARQSAQVQLTVLLDNSLDADFNHTSKYSLSQLHRRQGHGGKHRPH